MSQRVNLAEWADAAAPGDAVEYFRGFLAQETLSQEVGLQRAAFTIATASEAWAEYSRGRIDLTQRRLGPGQFSYIATRREKAPQV